MKNYYTVAIMTLVLVCFSHSLFAQGLTDDPRTTGVPVGSLLKPDGTLDLTTGFSGSLDVSGYRMESGPDGKPRFLPDPAGQSGSFPAGSLALQSPVSDDDEFWASGFEVPSIISGEIFALAVMENDLYIGGSFTINGETGASNVAKWDGESWSALGSGVANPTNSWAASVYALAVSGSDLYAGGDFTRAGGKDANYIAKWDGESWSDLDWGMNGRVSTLAIIGSELYAGGDFTIAGEAQATGVAKWNGATWSTLGEWEYTGVKAFAVSGSNLFVGGYHGIAIWNGSAWSTPEWQIDGTVYAFAVIGNHLYFGGAFYFWTDRGLAVNIAGSVVSPGGFLIRPFALGPELDIGTVFSLAVMDNILYAGADYGIAKWDGTEWSALGEGYSHEVRAIAFIGSDLYAVGWFGLPGATAINNIAKWDGENWSALFDTESVYGGFDNRVSALAVMGNDLYAGGRFTKAGGVDVNYVAKWDGESWSALGSGVTASQHWGSVVNALAVIGSNLYAGGQFITAGETTVNGIAKWDGESWSALGSGMGGYDYPWVYSLTVLGSDLYAGGQFATAGETTVNGIAKWDGESWSALGSGVDRPYGGALVSALAFIGSDLYVGGQFVTAGGRDVNNIAKWSAEGGWTALGTGVVDSWGYGEGAFVHVLAALGSDLYVGGNFATASGVDVNNIAKWSAESGWTALGSGAADPSWGPEVNALAVIGSNLYAGGRFTTAGGTTVNGIAKWDGENWSALGSGVTSPWWGAEVRAFAITGSDLYVGGRFTRAGDKPSGHIARWFKPVAAATVTRTFTTPLAEPLSFNEQDAVTGVSMQIKSPSGGPTVHVLRYDDAPQNPAGIRQDVSQFRWIIQQSGIAPNFNAEVRFRLSDLPDHGISDPGSVIVYQRKTPGMGSFYMQTTQYDAETEELVVKDVSDFGEFAFGNVAVSAEDRIDDFDIPVSYTLSQNYPNPFNPATTIEFSLPQPGMVTLTVYNMLGQRVTTLVSGELQAGSHSYQWDASWLASGVYIYRLQADGFAKNRTLMFLK